MEERSFVNAITYGDLETVQRLYDSCVADGCLANGRTVLSCACYAGQMEIVKWLVIDKRVDVNQQRSVALGKISCFEMARFMLEHGAKVPEGLLYRRLVRLYDVGGLPPGWVQHVVSKKREKEMPVLRLFMLWGGHLSPDSYKKLRKRNVDQAQWYCRVWDSVEHVLETNAAAVKETLLVLRFGRAHGADAPFLCKDVATYVAKLVFGSRRDFDVWDLDDSCNKRIRV